MGQQIAKPATVSLTKRTLLFLVLLFALSWTGLFIGANGPEQLKPLSWIALLSPAVAALTCAIAFEKGERLKALGLRFRPNWWWLASLFIAFGVIALCIVATAVLSPHKPVGLEEAARQLSALSNNEPYTDAGAYLMRFAAGVALNVLILSAFFGLSEELGWRGYLYHLWRRFGFWRSSFAIGLIWGLWHVPLNYVAGLNYPPEHQVLGLFLFPLTTMLLSPLLTLVREHGKSVWAACLLHGSYNAFAALTLIAVQAPQFPWTLQGLSGLIALGAASLIVALTRRRGENAPQ